jgi:MFS family permease
VLVSQLAIFIEFFGFGEQITLLPFYLDTIGAPRIGLGLVLTAQQGGIAIGSTVLGWFSDKYGRKNAVLLSLVANCLLSAVAAFCQSQETLMAIRFATGILTISTPSLSWLLANVDAQGKSQAIARWVSGLLLGIGLGSLLGGYVGQLWGWPSAMILVSLQGFVVALCCFYTDETPPPELAPVVVTVESDAEKQESTPLVNKPIHNLLTSPYFLAVVVASFLDGMSILSLHSTLSSLLKDTYGWEEDEIGAMNGVYALVCILTTWFLLRPVIDYLGAFKASLYGILLKTASIAWVGLEVGHSWRLYCAACLMYGLVYNLANPSLVALVSDMTRTFEPERMGMLIGIFRSANSLGSTVGPAIAVQLLSVNRMLPFAVLASSQLLIFVVIALMKLGDKKNRFLDTKQS